MFFHHPILWGILGILFVSLPNWAQVIWKLFSNEPLVPILFKKLGNKFKQWKIPIFSPYWISTSAGLILLFCIFWNTKPTPPPHIQNIKSDQESLYSDPPSGDHIDWDAVSAFKKGDYAYSILFFKK